MAQQIFSCEIVNRELGNGFSIENDLGGLSDMLIPKMTWHILYKGGSQSHHKTTNENNKNYDGEDNDLIASHSHFV